MIAGGVIAGQGEVSLVALIGGALAIAAAIGALVVDHVRHNGEQRA